MKDGITRSSRPFWDRETGVFYVCEICGKPAIQQINHYDPPITMDDERLMLDGVIPNCAIKIEYCCNECFGKAWNDHILRTQNEETS